MTESLLNKRMIDFTGSELKQLFVAVVQDEMNKCFEQSLAKPSGKKGLLTQDEAAKVLHITKATLIARTKAGKIQCYKVDNSRRVYYRMEDIEEALKPQINQVRR